MLADSFSPSPVPLWAVVAPLVAIAPAIYCMIDISRHPNTRQLTAPTWMVICAFGNVFGLVAYLKLGRSENR